MYTAASLTVWFGLAATVLAKALPVLDDPSADVATNPNRTFVPVDLPPPGDWIPTPALKSDVIRAYKANVSLYTEDTWKSNIEAKCRKNADCNSYAIRQSWYYDDRMWRGEIATGDPTTQADFIRAEPELDITHSLAWTWVPPPDPDAVGGGGGKKARAARSASTVRRSPAVPLVKLDLPAPGDWAVGKKLRDNLIATYKNAPNRPMDAGGWTKFMQEKCRARSACTSLHMYMGLDPDSATKDVKVWFGTIHAGDKATPDDYERMPGISESQAWSVLAAGGTEPSSL